jgi:hypothetical protein
LEAKRRTLPALVYFQVEGPVGRRHGGAGAAGLDDRGAPVLDLRHERILQPGAVGDGLRRRPLMRAFVKSGYWVLLWLPQIVTWVTSPLPPPAFFASAVRARLWSRCVIAV